MITLTIRPIQSGDWAKGPWLAEFHGPKATKTSLRLIAAEGGLLRADGPDNHRRFRPRDPLWWLQEAATEAVEVAGELCFICS